MQACHQSCFLVVTKLAEPVENVFLCPYLSTSMVSEMVSITAPLGSKIETVPSALIVRPSGTGSLSGSVTPVELKDGHDRCSAGQCEQFTRSAVVN